MKRFSLIIILSLLLSLFLTGCGGSAQPAAGDNPGNHEGPAGYF